MDMSKSMLMFDTFNIVKFKFHLIFIPFAVPPRFVNKIRNATLYPGEDVQFTCTIQSAPSPKIR